jgi:hypothetical protein
MAGLWRPRNRLAIVLKRAEGLVSNPMARGVHRRAPFIRDHAPAHHRRMTGRRQALAGAKPKGQEAAAKAAREHESIISSVHRLEAALASPAPGREAAWKQRAGAALVGVLDSLNVHRESAENKGGVIAEAEAVLGRPPTLAEARTQHLRLLKDGSELLADLEDQHDDPRLTCEAVRRRAWGLASALRNHQALEADLILEAFDLDIGGEG